MESSFHPFDPFIPKGATKLIIGTIPPPRFCKDSIELYDKDVNFYYGSKDNEFWHLLDEIFDQNFEYCNTLKAIEQRKKFLKKAGIGITDIVAECTHAKDSAADEDLKEIKYKNLKQLLTNNSGINVLIYTSEFVKKLVNSHLNTYHSIDPNNRKKQSIKIGEKIFQVRILYSPSPSALRNMGKGGTEIRKKQYHDFFTAD